MKQNKHLQKNSQSYFWRSLQQQEADDVEVEQKQIRAYKMKWTKKKYVTKDFTNLYPNAETMLVQPTNITEFCYLKQIITYSYPYGI